MTFGEAAERDQIAEHDGDFALLREERRVGPGAAVKDPVDYGGRVIPLKPLSPLHLLDELGRQPGLLDSDCRIATERHEDVQVIGRKTFRPGVSQAYDPDHIVSIPEGCT